MGSALRALRDVLKDMLGELATQTAGSLLIFGVIGLAGGAFKFGLTGALVGLGAGLFAGLVAWFVFEVLVR